MVKVSNTTDDSVTLSDGTVITSDHNQECCEHHYLDFSQVSLEDFDGLIFDVSSDTFFEAVADYGIRLVPTNGHPVSIPGYGYNNGYYSTNLTLVLSKPGSDNRTFDITECQDIKD